MAAAAEAAKFGEIEEELRQAMQSIPELARLADHLVVERTPEGLRIQIIDQARRSMFPLGSVQMYPPTRALLRKVTQAIEGLPNKVAITGHTDGRAFVAAIPTTTGRCRWTGPMPRGGCCRAPG